MYLGNNFFVLMFKRVDAFCRFKSDVIMFNILGFGFFVIFCHFLSFFVIFCHFLFTLGVVI